MPRVSPQPSRKDAVPRDLLGLTVRHVEAMTHGQLVDHLSRMTRCFPIALDPQRLAALADAELRQLVNRARRKLQAMGY